MIVVNARPQRAIGIWMLVCAGWVWALVVIGGVTRLTRSGLSITEWNPVTGILPPLDSAAWEAAFFRYRLTPEYRLINSGMTLSGFRSIYLVEYIHRLIARTAGLCFFGPLLWFAWKGRLKGRLRPILVIGGLGGCQGLVGWWMVKSGLVAAPHVSPYRLTTHLLFALTIYLLLLWYGISELTPRAPQTTRRLDRLVVGVFLALSLLTVTWGALMAGMRAGYVASTFPTMNGAWIPPGLGALGWLAGDAFENAVSVHFIHRLLALLTSIAAFSTAVVLRRNSRPPRIGALGLGVLAAVSVQVTLGAWTVLSSVALLPAALHQANAVLLLGLECALLHRVSQPSAAEQATSVAVAENC